MWHWNRYYRGPWLLRSIEKSGINSSNRSKWSCVRQPGSRGYTAPKTSKKSVLCVLHTCLHVCMKEWQSVWAWQYDVFYLPWISVIFRPAGVSHKASHGPKADSHWHWWTSRPVAHSPGALTSISDCSRSVTHKIYKTCRITPFLTSPLSHTHMHAHMLLQWSPSPAACVLCLREVVLGGRVGLSFPYADTVLHYTHCARKQQKDNDILYRRLKLDCTGALQRDGRRGDRGRRKNGRGEEKAKDTLNNAFYRRSECIGMKFKGWDGRWWREEWPWKVRKRGRGWKIRAGTQWLSCVGARSDSTAPMLNAIMWLLYSPNESFFLFAPPINRFLRRIPKKNNKSNGHCVALETKFKFGHKNTVWS